MPARYKVVIVLDPPAGIGMQPRLELEDCGWSTMPPLVGSQNPSLRRDGYQLPYLIAGEGHFVELRHADGAITIIPAAFVRSIDLFPK